MALVAATLGSGLASMEPTSTEADAISAFASAWDAYFAEASVMGVSATPGSYAVGLSAMQVAMSGMSAAGAGAQAVQLGIQAFWNAILALGPAIWTVPPPSVIVPPLVAPTGISGIAADLAGKFASNTSGKLDLVAAANEVANVIHPAGGVGGIANVQTAPSPTPAPTPIL